MNLKKFLLCGLILLFLASCGKKEEEVIKIGVVLSLTGNGATYGKWSLNGMELAAEELNKSDRFKNTPIKLIVEDSQSLTNQAVSSFRKLIEIDKVSVVVGMVLSDEVLACAPIANSTKTVLFTPGAGSIKIKDAGEYIFRNRESAELQTNKLAEYSISELGKKVIGILYVNAANGISYRDSFTESVNKFDGSIIVTQAFNEGETNFRTQLINLRNAKVDAIYIAGLDTEIGNILRQAKELNISTQFLASAGAVSDKVIELAGESAEGLICSTGSFDTTSSNQNVKNFIELYFNKFNERPEFVAANSYDAIFILSEIMINNLKGEQIKDRLFEVEKFDGVGGLTSFDEFGEVIKPVSIVVLKRNKFQLVSN